MVGVVNSEMGYGLPGHHGLFGKFPTTTVL